MGFYVVQCRSCLFNECLISLNCTSTFYSKSWSLSLINSGTPCLLPYFYLPETKILSRDFNSLILKFPMVLSTSLLRLAPQWIFFPHCCFVALDRCPSNTEREREKKKSNSPVLNKGQSTPVSLKLCSQCVTLLRTHHEKKKKKLTEHIESLWLNEGYG